MKQYKLFIDESGHPHQNHPSKHFALVGIIIEDEKQNKLKVQADNIKFKYWDKTNIVLHSEEIGRRAGDFKLFAKEPQLGDKFEKQLFQFLHSAPFMVVAAVVDKEKAYRVGWKEETIVTKAGESLVMDFLAFLYAQGKAQGRIVYETSGSTRDSLYLKAYHRYLDPNWEKAHPEFNKVREHITSITFAGKLNHDTETQIADILSYGVVCKYKKEVGLLKFSKDSYEDKVVKLLNKKLLSTPAGVVSSQKKKYYKTLKGIRQHPATKPKKISKTKKTA